MIRYEWKRYFRLVRGMLLVGIVGLAAFVGCSGRAAAAASAQVPQTALAAQSAPEPRVASVVGTGRVTLQPDLAVVQVGVRSEDPDIAQAVQSNIQKAQAIYDAVKALGVEEKDLQTTNFNVYRTTKGPAEQPREVFVAENTVRITVRNLEDLGAILGAALRAGVNQVYGLSFGASDYSQAMEEARRQALQDAQAQARLIAETLGVRLGPPRRVSFGGGRPLPRAEMVYKADMPATAPEAAVPVESGELVLQVQASVEFELLEP